MKFTVLWVPAAESELARIWTENDDRAAIAKAADTIDALLKTNPDEVGESRSDGVRVLISPPLVVYFRVKAEDRIVEIGAIRYFSSPN